jgi:glycosyltransferase involved in cell wall biosynthesis
VVELDLRYVPDEELTDLLARHHLVVLPYRSATQSGIVPLAHAAGRPVVATAVGGLVESVRDGVDGVLVPPDDAAALADGLERAAVDLAALAAGAAAVSTSWDDVATAVLQAAGIATTEETAVDGPH